MITFIEGWFVVLEALVMGAMGGLVGIVIGFKLTKKKAEVTNAVLAAEYLES